MISGDRWIPDQLCRAMSHRRGPEPFLIGPRWKDNQVEHEWTNIARPVPQPPNKNVKYLIDYCVFGSAAPKDLSEFSDEFDIPGYLDQGRFQLYGSRIDTHSHPGFLTVTKMGQSLECFAWGTPHAIDFQDFPPPWEIEACILPPSDRWNWDFDLGFGLCTRDGKMLDSWYPGVRNLPVSGRREYFSLSGNVPITFDPPLDSTAIGGERIHVLVQFMDVRQVRVAFRARDTDPWRFSRPADFQKALGQAVQKLIFVAWNASCGDPPQGEYVGFPLYQQYRWDYIRFRYDLTPE